jgi:hypothetical protein
MTRFPRLLDRVVQQRRREADQAEADEGGAIAQKEDEALQGRIAALERRVDHLETLLESLQDSVHRQSTRQQREIDILSRKTEPAEMARSLGRHSKSHGL